MRLFLVIICLLPLVRAKALTLGLPFGAHMVLPMERLVPVWGIAGPGAAISVDFAGKTVVGKADADGAWRVSIGPFPASAEGRELVVTEARERLAVEDVLVGRIWLCSGQSNMDFPLARATGGAAEAIAAGRFSGIRLCNLTGAPTDAGTYDAATLARLNVKDHFTGKWERASVKSAGSFSAIAWWAGKMIHERTGVPVGLVENAVGGSGTEAWLPHEMLEARADYQQLLDKDWLDSEKIGAWARGRAKQNLGARLDANHPFKPGFLFDSGVRGWAGFPFDGVLWYQGETNAEVDDIAWNRRLMVDLIAGWRKCLGDEELPFHMIELPRIGGHDPMRKYWPEYRQAQAEAAAMLKGVNLVRTKDLGYDSRDVHPPDKRPVAERLAAAVLKGLK